MDFRMIEPSVEHLKIRLAANCSEKSIHQCEIKHPKHQRSTCQTQFLSYGPLTDFQTPRVSNMSFTGTNVLRPQSMYQTNTDT